MGKRIHERTRQRQSFSPRDIRSPPPPNKPARPRSVLVLQGGRGPSASLSSPARVIRRRMKAELSQTWIIGTSHRRNQCHHHAGNEPSTVLSKLEEFWKAEWSKIRFGGFLPPSVMRASTTASQGWPQFLMHCRFFSLPNPAAPCRSYLSRFEKCSFYYFDPAPASENAHRKPSRFRSLKPLHAPAAPPGWGPPPTAQKQARMC